MSTHGLTKKKKKFKIQHGWHMWHMADMKKFQLFVLKYTKKKFFFFKKKTKLTWGSVGLSYPEK